MTQELNIIGMDIAKSVFRGAAGKLPPITLRRGGAAMIPPHVYYLLAVLELLALYLVLHAISSSRGAGSPPSPPDPVAPPRPKARLGHAIAQFPYAEFLGECDQECRQCTRIFTSPPGSPTKCMHGHC